MALTYKELLAGLQKFSEEELNMNVSVSYDGEVIPVIKLVTDWEEPEASEVDGILDDDHPFLSCVVE